MQKAIIKSRVIDIDAGEPTSAFWAWWEKQDKRSMEDKSAKLNKLQASEIICEVMQKNYMRTVELWELYTKKIKT